MECCSMGVATLDNTPKLAALLRGMCHRYGEFWEHVTVLKVPIQGGYRPNDETEIRIIKSFPSNPRETSKGGDKHKPEDVRWTVRHLSEPQRNRQLQTLPATVRDVIDAECGDCDVLDFWQAVGAKMDYDFYQSGNEYYCFHQSKELQVRLLLLTRVQGGNLEATHHLTMPGDNKRISDHLLQVTLRVGKDEGLEGAQALASFGQRLLPLVQLRRAQP